MITDMALTLAGSSLELPIEQCEDRFPWHTNLVIEAQLFMANTVFRYLFAQIMTPVVS